jgi:hypothetical protein
MIARNADVMVTVLKVEAEHPIASPRHMRAGIRAAAAAGTGLAAGQSAWRK